VSNTVSCCQEGEEGGKKRQIERQVLVLRSSLQPRLSHLAQEVRWTELAPPFARLEAHIANAFFTLIQWPRVSGSAEDSQVALPLRHAGFGLRSLSPIKAAAARLSTAVLTHPAMKDDPAAFRPFEG
jgi:hypothetical protein